MSPTAELEQEQMVSVPDTSTLYMSRRGELRLVKKPTRQTRDIEGNPAETIQGQTVHFRDGVYRLPAQGAVTIEAGQQVDADELRRWLEAHPLKDDVQEGFWRVDPTAPPPSQAELDRLQELAIELDGDGLEAFIAQEREGWARAQLIEVAERSLEKLQQRLAERQQLAADALEQARAEGRAEGEKGRRRSSGEG